MNYGTKAKQARKRGKAVEASRQSEEDDDKEGALKQYIQQQLISYLIKKKPSQDEE